MTPALGRPRWSALVASCAVFAGCNVLVPQAGSTVDGDDDDNVVGTGLEVSETSDRTNAKGKLRVDVEVTEGMTAFQVTGVSPSSYASVDELIGPDGSTVLYYADLLAEPFSLTNSINPSPYTAAFDWPIRDIDGPLATGTWSVWFAVTTATGTYLAGERLAVSVATKRDSDFTTGTVGVQIAYAEGLDQDTAVVDAIEAGVDRWRKSWADIGITLAEHYVTTDINPDLTFAFTGADEVEAVAASKGEGELQLIIGETVRSSNQIYGVSGGIPGSVAATPNTFVVLSWVTHAGPDGVFDDDEIRLMGDTMTHEIGHYMGLFHPVEASYDTWDALDDTDQCRNQGTCDDALGRNVMYPYSICTFASCQGQNNFTDQQIAVAHQFVGTL
ncbi:MAG: hypothetical protein ABMB14_02315 [Myxococcota bacterium]